MKFLLVFMLVFTAAFCEEKPANGTAMQKWAKEITAGAQIPTDKFLAFYLNKDEPKKVIFSQNVDRISVNYEGEGFRDIPSQNLMAYWVGEFNFDADVEKMVLGDYGWSTLVIAVDGTDVLGGMSSNKKRPLTYKFSKGKHKIEAWFLNDAHSSGLFVDFKDVVPFYRQKDAVAKIATDRDYDVWLGAVYESAQMDNKVKVVLEKSQKPLVLLLSSYRAVEWEISNPQNNEILATLVFNPISRAEGGKNVLYVEDYRYSEAVDGLKCQCISGKVFHCEGSEIYDMNERVLGVFGKGLSGFAGKHGANSLNLPSIAITPKEIEASKSRLAAVEADRKKCESTPMDDVFR
ncbi:hypothetical protein [uncultured Campylobacter sp.]|uniref:hypothetical protein n=1 Tax=uncultured Campylobacter sp. TaxID=218934 RepID=UPI00260C5810|nr:hypothetical protein [uncultured Campylobacter sp.]